MPNSTSVGRPRLYKNRAEKQADYRRRKDEKDFETRNLALRAMAVIAAARRTGIGEGQPDWKVLEIVAMKLAA